MQYLTVLVLDSLSKIASAQRISYFYYFGTERME